MECFKCGKKMSREDGRPTLTGVEVRVSAGADAPKARDILRGKVIADKATIAPVLPGSIPM